MIEASRIVLSLYQGSRPPVGPELAQQGFKLLVLCAQEHQPEASLFPGVRVLYAPNDDSNGVIPTREQITGAVQAAKEVREALIAGQKVLVTCWAGRNRSGLVSAVALHMMTGCTGKAVIHMVRQRRQHNALTNPHFCEALHRLRGTREGDLALHFLSNRR